MKPRLLPFPRYLALWRRQTRKDEARYHYQEAGNVSGLKLVSRQMAIIEAKIAASDAALWDSYERRGKSRWSQSESTVKLLAVTLSTSLP